MLRSDGKIADLLYKKLCLGNGDWLGLPSVYFFFISSESFIGKPTKNVGLLLYARNFQVKRLGEKSI